MGFIRIYEKSSKQKRKPGWQKDQEQYNHWLRSVLEMSTGFSSGIRPKNQSTTSKSSAQTNEQKVREARFVQDTGTKHVRRPELQYAHDQELLQRELKALQRKFNSAPAFNKGGSQFVSEEELQMVLSSNKRRS